MNENFYNSLDRLIIHLSSHCRKHRLVDLTIERLPENQRREVITATLDYFEQEIECLTANQGPRADTAPGDDAGERHLRPAPREFNH
ncbi:hypothetical protein K4K96_01190 [Phaeobacter inhibens]|uniref:hypothetical protein n=2 Tax=Phaeobacter TaxID=302485 RepID=UPI0021A85EC6|nr:hypothetical protein [Phaeobacter inhibens]UWR92699.1 hypothetical protein K4K96_01190 [Phaeobacter inhibens]